MYVDKGSPANVAVGEIVDDSCGGEVAVSDIVDGVSVGSVVVSCLLMEAVLAMSFMVHVVLLMEFVEMIMSSVRLLMQAVVANLLSLVILPRNGILSIVVGDIFIKEVLSMLSFVILLIKDFFSR